MQQKIAASDNPEMLKYAIPMLVQERSEDTLQVNLITKHLMDDQARAAESMAASVGQVLQAATAAAGSGTGTAQVLMATIRRAARVDDMDLDPDDEVAVGGEDDQDSDEV
jgi:hypothetical protein